MRFAFGALVLVRIIILSIRRNSDSESVLYIIQANLIFCMNKCSIKSYIEGNKHSVKAIVRDDIVSAIRK